MNQVIFLNVKFYKLSHKKTDFFFIKFKSLELVMERLVQPEKKSLNWKNSSSGN